MKLRFIDDVRGSWKLLTVWVGAAWAGLFGWLANDPTALLSAYNSLPDDLKALFPTPVRIAIGFVGVLGTLWLARTIKQPVRRKDEDEHHDGPG